jgi:ABC-type multidrug transport system ATPase subunit
MTVFLSSHLVAEVQELCERVAIISAGRIVYEGSLEDLRARAGRRCRLSVADQARAMALCRGTPGVAEVRAVGEQIEFAVDDDSLLRVTRALVRARDPRAHARAADAGASVLRADRPASSRRAGRRVIGGVYVAYRGELFKLLAQRRTWLGFALRRSARSSTCC